MITSRSVYTAFGISLWLNILMISTLAQVTYAQISPPPGSGTPGTTTGGGSRP